jgi:hypothetical protein
LLTPINTDFKNLFLERLQQEEFNESVIKSDSTMQTLGESLFKMVVSN